MTLANGSGSQVAPPLPGETRRSEVLEDAQHWVSVYEHLISFLLEVQGPDADKVGSVRTRLGYWRHRRDELAANPIAEAPLLHAEPSAAAVDRARQLLEALRDGARSVLERDSRRRRR